MDEKGAREEGVANPPKVCREPSQSVVFFFFFFLGKGESLKGSQVIYHDQHGHRVAHNPSTLSKGGPD